MPTVRIRTIPISRTQKKFRESKAWMTGFCAGRGAGKTKIGAIHICRTARKDDPCMCISPDANMIRDTTLPTFIETVKFTGQYIRHVTTPTPRVLFYTEDGGVSELMFKGAEKPDKLRGPSKAILWFDEASIISKEAFDYGIAVCRHRGRMSPVLCTFTPRGFKHWTFESFYEPIDESMIGQIGNDGSSLDGIEWFKGRPYRPKPNTHLIFCATKDNPFAPREFSDIIGSNYSQMLREQELGGQFVEISGLMFRREWFRMVDESPRNATRIRYWDKACLIASTKVDTINGPVSIEKIKKGDKVLTRDGYRKVEWSGKTKSTNQIVSVVFSNGSVVTGTRDHLVWTRNRNWVELGSLRDGDHVLSGNEVRGECQESETKSLNRLSSMACDTFESQGGDTSTATAGILKKSNTNTVRCTETFGKASTGTYPMATISTTLTKTGAITTYRIWSVCHRRNISNCTQNSISQELLSQIQSITEKQWKLFQIGSTRIATTKSISSNAAIEATQHGVRFKPRLTVAKSAGRSLSHVKSVLSQDFAQRSALLNQGHQSQNESESLFAKYAIEPFRDLDELKRVQTLVVKGQGKPIPVYDLTVDDRHEFFANGVLVHNCTPGSGAYSAGVLMARDDRGIYYVEDVVRGQWGAHERNTVILQTAQRDAWKYRGNVTIYIEQEGAGSGKEVTDQLIVMLSEFPVYRDLASGSAQGFKLKGGIRLPGDAKIRRAQPFSAQAEAGNVCVVNARWNGDFLEELCAFPEYRFVDQVDAASACMLKLAAQAPDGIHASQDIVNTGIDFGLLGSLGGNAAERYLEEYSRGAKRSYDVDPRDLLGNNDSNEDDYLSSPLPWNR
jgi:predicted phage terminase large subunit-like protein